MKYKEFDELSEKDVEFILKSKIDKYMVFRFDIFINALKSYQHECRLGIRVPICPYKEILRGYGLYFDSDMEKVLKKLLKDRKLVCTIP